MAFFLTDAFLRANGLRIACDNRTAPGFIAGLPETGYLRLDTFLPWLEARTQAPA